MKEALPQVLQEVAEAVERASKDPRAGLEAALRLAEAKGGQRVYIPVRPGLDHWLTLAVGSFAAQAIARHYTTGDPPKGAEIDVPMGPAGTYVQERRRRARLLGEAIKGNLPVNAIAARAGVTRRAVFYAKGRLASDASQPSLFDDEAS